MKIDIPDLITDYDALWNLVKDKKPILFYMTDQERSDLLMLLGDNWLSDEPVDLSQYKIKENVTRVEIINQKWKRVYTTRNIKASIDYQDDWKTLKIFIN